MSESIPSCFVPAEILLPDFSAVCGTRWSVIACDQYTSEPEYWEEAERIVGDAPSTLRLMLPEIFLGESGDRIPRIHAAMETALREQLVPQPDAMIYLERTQSDGRVRRGLIGAVDLECYNYLPGAQSLIRATEGTVLERIPPRVAVRRGAPLELPHVMLLVDDPGRTVIEPLTGLCRGEQPLYDYDLMLGGGHVTGWLLPRAAQAALPRALAALVTPEAMRERYGSAAQAPLLFAVGDGNHSLASAKAAYEEIKQRLGEEAARRHPARYALAEVVNLHDDALDFEPIYRVVFGANPELLVRELEAALRALHGEAAPQSLTVVTGGGERVLTAPHPEQQLPVGTLQTFLDGFLRRWPEARVDYIHGEDALRRLAAAPGAVGFLFAGMKKDELFRTVICDGALPRKTFSMGHAQDKRYYLECRRLLPFSAPV